MRMFSGQLVDPLNLKVEDIRGDDICWALSNICRYGGHCHTHFSVGEHTLNVASSVRTYHKRLYALLHDASEAYLGDIPTPLKRRMPGFVEAEGRAQRVVARAFGLNEEDFLQEIETGEVKKADYEALKTEQRLLWSPRVEDTLVRPSITAAQLFSEMKTLTPTRLHARLGLNKPHIFC